MQNHEKALLDLLGRELFGATVEVPAEVLTEDLFQESCHQAVAALAWQALTDSERAALPSEVKAKWRKRTLKQISKNQSLLNEQQSVLNLLSAEKIPCAILKGSSVACNYPEPLLRAFGDMDLLVPEGKQRRAVEMLQAVGYGEILDEKHGCHYSVSKKKHIVEIHWEPNGINIVADAEISEKLHAYFKNALQEIQARDGLPVLNTEYQAVVLLMHKLEHFLYGGLGLRQLCDWACFVYKQLSEEDFEKLRPTLEAFGLMEFAGIITRACCDWLHLPVEFAPWCMEYDENLAKDVLEEMVAGGNFGRKQKIYGKRFFEDYASSNRFTSALKTLAASCHYHWPPCKKHPILMPIGVIFNGARYLKLRVQGKRPALHPVKLFQESGPRQKLYQSLKPFQK